MERCSFQEELMMHRFYADSENEEEQLFFLSPEDTYHALRVLRFRSGAAAEIFCRGQRFLAVFESESGDRACFRSVHLLPSTEPALSVTLFQGLPKGDKMEWIVQKAVELGVSRIVPVAFSRCVVRFNAKDAGKKQERWQKIAREAGKQAGRCNVPDVSLPLSFSELSPFLSVCEQVAVPWEDCSGGGPLSFVHRHPSLHSLGIVIGPEGGISPEEIEYLVSANCEPVTLGKRILRTETAGLAAVSVFLGLYGEME